MKLIDDGLASLSMLLTSPPVIEHRYCNISKRYQWLQQAAGVAVNRLIRAVDASALMPNSLAILHVLSAGERYNDGGFDVQKLGLADAVQQWPELKWAMFWNTVEQERKTKAKKGERMIDCWIAMVTAIYVSFGDSDFDAAVQAISERTLADDKLVALSLAFRLYVETDRQRSRLNQMKRVIGEDAHIKTRLAELMKPPKNPVQLSKWSAN